MRPSSTKRILLGLSGSPYTRSAIAHALDVAVAHEASVTGVTVVNLRAATNVGSVPAGAGALAIELGRHRASTIERKVEESIAAFEKAATARGVPFSVVREEGSPFDALHALWHVHDLVVIGLRGFFDYGVLRHPDDWLKGLMRFGVRPVLAVAEKPRAVRRVLVAYNGTYEAAKAMKSFVQRRIWSDAVVRVVCFEARTSTADELLASAAGYCRDHGYAVDTAHPEGSAQEGLLAHATEWGADLLVLGATPRQRIVQVVFGDTALSVIRDSHIPLFLTQ